MGGNSFYMKVINFLDLANKGTHKQLIENGWITSDDAVKIVTILMRLGLIEKNGETIFLTKKGLNILLYYRMGNISVGYNEEVLNLLLRNDTKKS